MVLGYNVQSATIKRSPGAVGCVHYDLSEDLEVEAVIALAGRAGELLFVPRETVDELGWRTDMQRATSLCLTLAGGDADDLLEVLEARTRELLLEHQHQMDEISIALLERHTLTGAELLELVLN